METLVTGAGGFIGGHLVKRLVEDGHIVTAVDSKSADDWWQLHPHAHRMYADFNVAEYIRTHHHQYDRVYHLAANMGGIGFIEGNKLDCALSTEIDIALLRWARDHAERVFYSSSACVYAGYVQNDRMSDVLALAEFHAYPADPEDGYGWQKLYTERLCRHFYEDADLETRVARYHNIFGPHGTWEGGREKAPAALCRKVATAVLKGEDHIEIWGDGTQVRSFLYIDECIEGTLRLMESDCRAPINIGSSESVTIDELARMIMLVAGVDLKIKHVPGALGVRGRSSDNTLCYAALGWAPDARLLDGLKPTYRWVYDQVKESLGA